MYAGCYVEGGDFLKNRFPWKTNLGLNEHRSGHLNDVWGYWSTDGELPSRKERLRLSFILLFESLQLVL